MNSLGIAFIPGTFPTAKVLEYITTKMVAGEYVFEWSRAKINRLYFAYKDAVMTENLTPYGPGNTTVSRYVTEKTGYGLDDSQIFLLALYKMVQEKKLNPGYWNFQKALSSPVEVVKKAIKDLAEGTEKTAKNLKWIGIIALVGVGIYFTFPLLMMARKKFKKRSA